MTIDAGTAARINNDFDYHQPGSSDVVAAHEAIRSACKEAAQTVAELVPQGREQSLALTKLEEAGFWANAGIARHS
jgi:hypothetical protein